MINIIGVRVLIYFNEYIYHNIFFVSFSFFVPQRIDGVSPEDVSKNPKVYKRICRVPHMINIDGENFGTSSKYMTARVINKKDPKQTFQIYPPSDDVSHECPNLVFKHNRMSLCSPIGYGMDHQLEVKIGNQLINNQKIDFSFEPPRILSVNRRPYDGSKIDSLDILGINFGGVNVGDVKVNIGNFPCDQAKWHASYKADGFPYISCKSRVDVVGSKNISLFVAGQNALPVPILQNDFTSIIRSECLPGEITIDGKPNNTWARRGELCAPCPVGAICRKGGYQIPIAEKGFWLNSLDITNPDAAAAAETTNENNPMILREKFDYIRALESDDVTKIRRCPGSRLFDTNLDALLRTQHPIAASMKRDLCLEAQPCLPNNACIGDNQCNEGYLYQQKKCEQAVLQNKKIQTSNCTVSLQCRTRSYGIGCSLAIGSVCNCPKENELGSYSCVKKCILEKSEELLNGGCPSKKILGSLHAGQECLSNNPEDCSSCVINSNVTTLNSMGTCECTPAKRCSLCTANGKFFFFLSILFLLIIVLLLKIN